MKQFISLGMLLVVLSSCGTETVVVEDAIEVPTEAIEQTVSDIDTELANLESGDVESSSDEDLDVTVDADSIVIDDGDSTVTISEDGTEVTGNAVIISDLRSDDDSEGEVQEATSKVTKVQAKYNNTQQDVVLDIEYSLDDEGNISTIEITDTNGYDLWRNFSNDNLDVLIGKSLDEVDDTYISGGTWTVPAIKNALTGE
jgi:hypothetical protein